MPEIPVTVPQSPVRDLLASQTVEQMQEVMQIPGNYEPKSIGVVDDFYITEDAGDWGPAMRRCRNYLKEQGGGLMQFRKRVYNVSSYEASASRQAVCNLSFSGITVAGRGKGNTIISLPSNATNRNIFVLGDPLYNQQTNRSIIRDVVIRDLTLDLNNAREFCTGVNFDTPVHGLDIIRVEGVQSGLRLGEPSNHNGDSWLISFARTYAGSQAGTLNDYDEDIRILECDSYDEIQLTANLGGIQRMRIAGNRSYDARNNGIAVTGVDHRAYIQDLVIENNLVVNARGRAIWVGLDDSPSRPYFFNNGFDRPFCARNVVIRNNTIRGLTPGSAGWVGVLLTTYPKGFDGLHIYNNTIEETTSTTSAAIYFRSRGFNEPTQTIACTAADLTGDTIPCDTRNLGEGTLVRFKKTSGSVLPGGILDGKPYYLKPVGAQAEAGAIELYNNKSSSDVLNVKVNLHANGVTASGSMVMEVIGGFTNVTVENNNVTCYRAFRWQGVANGTLFMAKNTWNGRVVFEQGHVNDGNMLQNLFNGTIEIDGPLDARRWWWRDNWARRRRGTDNSNNSAILSISPAANYSVSFIDYNNLWECFDDGADLAVATEPIYCVASFDVPGTVRFSSYHSRATGSASRAYRIDAACLAAWDSTYNLNRSNDEALGIKDPQPFAGYRQKFNVTFDQMLTGGVSSKTVAGSGMLFANRGNLPVKVTPAGWSQAGDVHLIARVSGDGVITLTARNLTGSTITPVAADFWLEVDGRLV